MNERIKYLVEQANARTFINEDGSLTPELKRFTELVVKACADAADMAQDAGCEYAGDYVAEYMGFGEQEGVTEWRAK
jgi:hypothetical protein